MTVIDVWSLNNTNIISSKLSNAYDKNNWFFFEPSICISYKISILFDSYLSLYMSLEILFWYFVFFVLNVLNKYIDYYLWLQNSQFYNIFCIITFVFLYNILVCSVKT